MSSHSERDRIIQACNDVIERVIDSELVQDVIGEQLMNLGHRRGGLPEYGLEKIARTACVVAYCEATGTPLDMMRLTPDEIADRQAALINAFADDGKPVIVAVADRNDESES